MAIKDLFNSSEKLLPSKTLQDIGDDIESADYIRKSLEEKDRFIPYVDYSDPKNFARYGLAEEYYADSINYILTSYPYDGSLKEKIEWEVSASYLDRFIFDKEYPRTTGYINMGNNYGSLVTSSNGYAQTATSSYITFRGGPHTASDGMVGKPLYETFSQANIYDPTLRRENNLEINGTTGVTLEFWLKKNGFTSGSESGKQVIFDVWNSSSLGSGSYGRFRVEIHPGIVNETNKFYVELQSGSAGLSSGSSQNLVPLGNGLNILDGVWHQYSLSVINSGSSMVARLYTSGSLNDTVVTGSSINIVTGSLIGNIGSLISSATGSSGSLGWAKLSGSLDELRFYKVRRNAKQVGTYWFTQVGAGTNSDPANTSLGLYYKFNEGIMNTSSVHPLDIKILDYSGRISNGMWIGYVTGSRSTGSALETNTSVTEFRDPIIYSAHSGVASLSTTKQEIGFDYDTTNNANIYGTFPEWITKDDEEKGHEELKKLSQTISSFLDTVHLQIEALPQLKSATYISSSYKPIPFVSRYLENMGMITPEIFTEAEGLEALASRDTYREYEEKLADVKNRIYQNIYNNLSYIYKSKGTEKSFRNLIRCFGIDDELIKINLYGDNVTYELKDNVRYTSVPKKYIDFNDVDRFYTTVYQNTSSATSSKSYVSASSSGTYSGQTYECEAIFPKKFEKDNEFYFDTAFTTSSVFGAHTAIDIENGQKTWATSDIGNFQVLAIRPRLESKDVFFMLTGTAGYSLPVITSSLFSNVYDNQRWLFAVKIKPSTYPLADGVTGSDSTNNFTVEFSGYNTVMDIVPNSFNISSSMSASSATSFMTSPRRFFVGAHRTNFTGSVLSYTDVKISNLRVWMKYLTEEEIVAHAKDALNFGTLHPYRNIRMFQGSPTASADWSPLDLSSMLSFFQTFSTTHMMEQEEQFVPSGSATGSVGRMDDPGPGAFIWATPPTNAALRKPTLTSSAGLASGIFFSGTGATAATIKIENSKKAMAFLNQTITGTILFKIKPLNDTRAQFYFDNHGGSQNNAGFSAQVSATNKFKFTLNDANVSNFIYNFTSTGNDLTVANGLQAIKIRLGHPVSGSAVMVGSGTWETLTRNHGSDGVAIPEQDFTIGKSSTAPAGGNFIIQNLIICTGALSDADIDLWNNYNPSLLSGAAGSLVRSTSQANGLYNFLYEWLDFTDTSTMYQATGTVSGGVTPVTAGGQSIQRINHKFDPTDRWIRNAHVSGATNAPIYSTTSGAVFDGIDDNIILSASMQTGGRQSYFMVVQATASHIMQQGSNFWSISNGAHQIVTNLGSTPSASIANTGSFNIVEMRRSGSAWTARTNGIAANSVTAGASGTFAPYAFGSGSATTFLSGSIKEVMLYNAFLTDAQADVVVSYLKTKHSIP